MRFELTLYDTESRENRALEYTESRRRAWVWGHMPRVQLAGSWHHLIWRCREYSTGPVYPTIYLDRTFDRALEDRLMEVKGAKALTLPQLELLQLMVSEQHEDGEAPAKGATRRAAKRLVSLGLAVGVQRCPEGGWFFITDKGRDWLDLVTVP